MKNTVVGFIIFLCIMIPSIAILGFGGFGFCILFDLELLGQSLLAKGVTFVAYGAIASLTLVIIAAGIGLFHEIGNDFFMARKSKKGK